MTRLAPAALEASIVAARQALEAGEIVALPTETVYGLAARACDDTAVAKIFAAKDRPQINPLIIHVSDAAQAQSLAEWTDTAATLARAFWPGPLSLVLPRRPEANVSALATAGLDTIALRAPAHPVTRAIIARLGPLAMPSANPSGRLSPTRAADVARELHGKVALVIDGGPAQHGLESTVVNLTGATPQLLRAGPIDRDTLLAKIGALADPCPNDDAAPQSPGRLKSHYAPARARLELDVTHPAPNAAYLGFGPGPWSVINLSPRGDLTQAAARLFPSLRAMDNAGFAVIAVAPIPKIGLGEALNDRLLRAAQVEN